MSRISLPSSCDSEQSWSHGHIFMTYGLSFQILTGQTGDCLLSSGDDGMVRFWKRSISGKWLEFAETDMADEYASNILL